MPKILPALPRNRPAKTSMYTIKTPSSFPPGTEPPAVAQRQSDSIMPTRHVRLLSTPKSKPTAIPASPAARIKAKRRGLRLTACSQKLIQARVLLNLRFREIASEGILDSRVPCQPGIDGPEAAEDDAHPHSDTLPPRGQRRAIPLHLSS